MKKSILKRDKTNDNSLKVGKTIISTVFKTLGILLFVFGFFVVSLSVFFPKTMIKSFDAVGLNKAGYLVQKRLYERNKSNENLYNLIQYAIEMENYEDQVKYIEILISSDDYSKFCEMVDVSTRKTLGEKYSVYADSYDTYLRRHLVISLYNTDRELEAKMMAIDSVYSSLDELYVYISLVVTDEKLTDFQKESELTTLYSRYSIVSALETKLLELDELLSLSNSAYNSIIVLEQKVKLAEIQQILGKFAGNSALEKSAKENQELWQNEINSKLEELN